MREHSFADSSVYKYDSNFWVRFFHVTRYFWAKIKRLLREYRSWNCVVGDNCYFSGNTFIHNKGVKNKIVLGNNVACRGGVRVELLGRIVIGNNTYIGDDSLLYAHKLISIGDNVLIAHGVHIFDNNSHPTDSKARRMHYSAILGLEPNYSPAIDVQEVIIESDVWIGFNAIVLKGVTIGKGSIVAAGSIVTKNVPPHVVVRGNPAIVVKILEEDYLSNSCGAIGSMNDDDFK